MKRALGMLLALALLAAGCFHYIADDVPTLYAPTCPPVPTCEVIFVTITPTPTLTPTSTPTAPPTPTLESAWIDGTALVNVRLRAEIGTSEKVLGTIKAGERVQIHKLLLNFDPYATAPYGIYLWGYVKAAGSEGWAALGEMSGWAITEWYIEPSEPILSNAEGYFP